MKNYCHEFDLMIYENTTLVDVVKHVLLMGKDQRKNVLFEDQILDWITTPSCASGLGWPTPEGQKRMIELYWSKLPKRVDVNYGTLNVIETRQYKMFHLSRKHALGVENSIMAAVFPTTKVKGAQILTDVTVRPAMLSDFLPRNVNTLFKYSRGFLKFDEIKTSSGAIMQAQILRSGVRVLDVVADVRANNFVTMEDGFEYTRTGLVSVSLARKLEALSKRMSMRVLQWLFDSKMRPFGTPTIYVARYGEVESEYIWSITNIALIEALTRRYLTTKMMKDVYVGVELALQAAPLSYVERYFDEYLVA